MTVRTTRPTGLGIAFSHQAEIERCDEVSTLYNPINLAQSNLCAEWVRNWYHEYLDQTPYGYDYDFWPHIDNLSTAYGTDGTDGDGRWQTCAINDAKETARFYTLWTEPNNPTSGSGGNWSYAISPVTAATMVKTWGTDTRKLINGVWRYTKWGAPGILITSEGSGAYGIGSGGGARAYMDTFLANLNSAQVPNTWTIDIYCDSAYALGQIWTAWKNWMSTNGVLRPTVVLEFGSVNVNSDHTVQRDLMDKVSELIRDDTKFAGAAFYGLGIERDNPGHCMCEMWQWNKSITAEWCPYTNWTRVGCQFRDIQYERGFAPASCNNPTQYPDNCA